MRESLRLVIQCVCGSSSARRSYRIVGYSERHTYRAVEFSSLDDLLKVLESAVPAFDVKRVSREREGGSSILFADAPELSKEQLSRLGLRE